MYGEKLEEEKYLNKSLDKALAVIDLFSLNPTELSATEIASKMDTRPGTIYPILYTLEKHGYLHRDEYKKYSLELKFLEKGRLILEKMDLHTQARPELEKLRDETNETVHLAVLDKGEVVYIDKIEPRRTIRMYSSIGKRAPAHCTGVGKALLAYLPEKEIEKIEKRKGLAKYTDNTITSLAELKRELGRIREQGYAIDNAEHEEEIRCVSCPIYDYSSNVIAALSLTIPSFRASQQEIEKFAPIVMEYARKISKRMGAKSLAEGNQSISSLLREDNTKWR